METNEAKDLLELLKILNRMNAEGHKVSREINAVLALILLKFGLTKEMIGAANGTKE